MACEYLWNDVQEVALYSPILFRSSIPCNRGLIIHEDETGNFILRGVNTGNCCNQWTHYQVTFNGNIALPEEAEEVVPIAVALTVNGEPRYVSRAIFTPAAVDEYGNVTSTAIIKVPRCCCFSLGVEAVPATTDPTITPAPIIEVQNANLTISRVA
ncbi:MAG: hypothetical protein J6S14_03050 [Clostridia bacterium]|nr:hypothetical protein [Clostridia bacterium]